jgi:hypothetical protein
MKLPPPGRTWPLTVMGVAIRSRSIDTAGLPGDWRDAFPGRCRTAEPGHSPRWPLVLGPYADVGRPPPSRCGLRCLDFAGPPLPGTPDTRLMPASPLMAPTGSSQPDAVMETAARENPPPQPDPSRLMRSKRWTNDSGADGIATYRQRSHLAKPLSVTRNTTCDVSGPSQVTANNTPAPSSPSQHDSRPHQGLTTAVRHSHQDPPEPLGVCQVLGLARSEPD